MTETKRMKTGANRSYGALAMLGSVAFLAVSSYQEKIARASRMGGTFGSNDRGLSGGTTKYDETTDSDEICELSETDFRSASGLFAIVTGCHHSGTTLVSQLIMSSPNLYGPVECGMLDSTVPGNFSLSRYYPRAALSEEDRPMLLRAGCHAEMYRWLGRRSPLFRGPETENSMIVDKAPAYISDLVGVMDRSPGVPVIVTQKDDEYQIGSCMKHRHNREVCVAIVRDMKFNLDVARRKYPDRIHVANTTALYHDPDAVMSGVYAFLNSAASAWSTTTTIVEATGTATAEKTNTTNTNTTTRAASASAAWGVGSMDWKHGYLSMEDANAKARSVGSREMTAFMPGAIRNNHVTSRFADDHIRKTRLRERIQRIQRQKRRRERMGRNYDIDKSTDDPPEKNRTRDQAKQQTNNNSTKERR